jgi:hypothetical protein
MDSEDGRAKNQPAGASTRSTAKHLSRMLALAVPGNGDVRNI